MATQFHYKSTTHLIHTQTQFLVVRGQLIEKGPLRLFYLKLAQGAL